MYFTWKTTKENNTYIYTVTKNIPTNQIQDNGSYCITTTERTGVCKNRAKAVKIAKKITTYLNNK